MLKVKNPRAVELAGGGTKCEGCGQVHQFGMDCDEMRRAAEKLERLGPVPPPGPVVQGPPAPAVPYVEKIVFDNAMDDLRSRVAALSSRSDQQWHQREAAFVAAVQEVREEVARSKRLLQAKYDEMAVLTEKLSEVSNDISGVCSQGDLTSVESILNDQLDHQRGEVEELMSRAMAQNERIDTLKEEIDSLSTVVDSKASMPTMERVSGRVEVLQSLVDQHSRTLMSLDTVNVRLRDRLEDLAGGGDFTGVSAVHALRSSLEAIAGRVLALEGSILEEGAKAVDLSKDRTVIQQTALDVANLKVLVDQLLDEDLNERLSSVEERLREVGSVRLPPTSILKPAVPPPRLLRIDVQPLGVRCPDCGSEMGYACIAPNSGPIDGFVHESRLLAAIARR